MSKADGDLRRFVEWYGILPYFDVLSRLQESGTIERAKLLGLDPREAVALHIYTTERPDGSALFKSINSALRNQNALELVRLAPVIEVMQKALLKLPTYIGVAYRRTDLPKELERRLMTPNIIGNPFVDRGFLSASAKRSAFPGRWTMVIYGKNGRNIEPFSRVPAEREILFQPSTRFLIRHIEHLQERQMLLVLEEN